VENTGRTVSGLRKETFVIGEKATARNRVLLKTGTMIREMSFKRLRLGLRIA
jgi:hypothetical protein